MRQRNPKGRYIEGEIGKGNTHTKSLQVSLELYIILCCTFSVCVYASSFATAIVLLSKLSGREGNLNVYLTWLWLIPNWAYSTSLHFLCLCVSFINPRRACAARVTVVVSVCLCVCVCVCLHLFSRYRHQTGS